MFLARKVTRAKWDRREGLQEGEVAADAVTTDLRTHDNKLSFWRCGSGSAGEIRSAALALAAGLERLEKVELVWIAASDLVQDGLDLSNSPGRTPIEDLAERHVDVGQLDYSRLGKVAVLVSSALGEDRHRRLARQAVRELLAGAIRDGRLQPEDLRPKLASELDGGRKSST